MIINDLTPCFEVIVDDETGHVARLIADREGELFGEPGRVWITYHRDQSTAAGISNYSPHRTRKSAKAFLRRVRQLRISNS
jgi:hypothetical protein